MDKQTFSVLEFDRVLEMAAAFAVTAPGGKIVNEMRPLAGIDEIRRRIRLVAECRRLLSEGRSLGIEHFDDLSTLFKRVRPADSVIEPFELRSFLPLLRSSLHLKQLSDDPLCEMFGKVVSGLTTHTEINNAIDQSIDREGKIRDEASRELSSVRRGIRSFEGRE